MKNQANLLLALSFLVCAVTYGDVLSDFEDGKQGWTVIEPFNGNFLHLESGGNPDGCVRVYDTMAGGGALKIKAPVDYTGNLSNCPHFSFDAYVYQDGSQSDPDVTSEPRVFLISGDTIYKHTWPDRVIGQWQTLTVNMESSEWTRITGSLSFEEVLVNVEELWLGMDMHWDWTTRNEIKVDNIVLAGVVLPIYYIISPNGGEELWSGSTYEISWEMPAGSVSTVLEYSTDAGANWDYIDEVAGDTYYVWDVPDEPSDQCLIRITDPVNAYTDVSDAFFEIRYPAEVFTPNGGEVFVSGTTSEIIWQMPDETVSTVLEYSTDAGANWDYIDEVEGDTYYVWDVPYEPNEASEQCLIRITDPINAYTDESDEFFEIRYGIAVHGPNGGEELMSGFDDFIVWKASPHIWQVSIEYTTNNGTDWQLLEPNVPSTYIDYNDYNWFVWDSFSDECKVRVTDVTDANEPGVFDTSDDTFTILSPLLLHWPNGGERLMPGMFHLIEWESAEGIENVLIEYSTNNGASWTAVNPPNMGNDGIYDWEIPASPSRECLVRISDANDLGIYDTSDSTFRILSLNLLSPNGGECLQAEITTTIEWESFATLGDVLVEYSLDGGPWTEVVPPNTGNTGSYNWSVPVASTIYCKVRVTNPADPNDYDTNDSMFSIYPCLKTPTDLDGSCYVDIDDALIFAGKWLAIGCGTPDWCSGTDFDKSTTVTLIDFRELSQDWLFCGNICDPTCLLEPWPMEWNWPYQCRGDVDNEEEPGLFGTPVRVYINDWNLFVDAYGTGGSAYPDPPYNPAADFDRDGDVDDDDFAIMEANMNKDPSELDVCFEGGIWPPR